MTAAWTITSNTFAVVNGPVVFKSAKTVCTAPWMVPMGVAGELAVDEGAGDVGAGDDEDAEEEEVLMVTDE